MFSKAAEEELRLASVDDLLELRRLIEESVRGLSAGYYTTVQIESSLRYLFGPDTQLIHDGTYYVIQTESGRLAAAGGWSRRRTLFGGDQTKEAEDPRLDPATDPARIRAFFVHPDRARRGLGRRIFQRCAAEAARDGFRTLELMATLPGEPLYRALGFQPAQRSVITFPDGVGLPVVRMVQAIPGAAGGGNSYSSDKKAG